MVRKPTRPALQFLSGRPAFPHLGHALRRLRRTLPVQRHHHQPRPRPETLQTRHHITSPLTPPRASSPSPARAKTLTSPTAPTRVGEGRGEGLKRTPIAHTAPLQRSSESPLPPLLLRPFDQKANHVTHAVGTCLTQELLGAQTGPHSRNPPLVQKIKNPTPLFPTKTPPPHDLVRKKGPKRAPPTGPLEAQYAPAKPDHPLALCPWRPWLLGVHPSSPSSLRSLRLSGPSLPTRPKPRQTTP